MKFSNTTFSFYPSEEELLQCYHNLPEDLKDVSEEDYNNFLNGGFGTTVQMKEDGSLEERITYYIIDYKNIARNIRDSIRSSIDTFLQPASTISDELVTEEQKATLIQDSLALAKWPAQAGWPYIDLPILSDLCKSLLSIPVWEYPTQKVS